MTAASSRACGPRWRSRTCRCGVGVDASVRRDSTALAAVAWDREDRRARLVWHQVFQPTVADPIDFEAAVEDTLLRLGNRFLVREVRYDPFQMVATAQRLGRSGLPMLEFPQTSPNLTAASSNLYELFKGRPLAALPWTRTCGWRCSVRWRSRRRGVGGSRRRRRVTRSTWWSRWRRPLGRGAGWPARGVTHRLVSTAKEHG